MCQVASMFEIRLVQWRYQFPSRVHSVGELASSSKNLFTRQVDPRTSISQLHDPKEQHPISIIGSKLPSFSDMSISTSLALSEFLEPHDERNLQLLLTPKYCFTDLHLDVPALLGT